MLILYAEDDTEDREIFLEIIKAIDASITCLTASDGIDALNILRNLTILPQYIFLDINMPLMDGRLCLMNIKKDKRFEEIPIVMYTTSTSVMDMKTCKELGADHYIIKPNSYMEAVDRVRKVLHVL